MTAVTDSDLLGDAKVGKYHGFGRALLVENEPTIPTMVLAICKGERRSTAQANV